MEHGEPQNGFLRFATERNKIRKPLPGGRGLMVAELVAQAIFEPMESIPSVVSEYALMRREPGRFSASSRR